MGILEDHKLKYELTGSINVKNFIKQHMGKKYHGNRCNNSNGTVPILRKDRCQGWPPQSRLRLRQLKGRTRRADRTAACQKLRCHYFFLFVRAAALPPSNV